MNRHIRRYRLAAFYMSAATKFYAHSHKKVHTAPRRKVIAMSCPNESAWRKDEYSFVTSEGIRLSFSDTGFGTPSHPWLRGHETTVLFLHGWTQNRQAWDRVAGPLHDRDPELRITALDHRGHGRSDAAPGGAADITLLAKDIAEFITATIPTGQIVLIGHSMGAMSMMGLAINHPDLVAQRISAAVFMNTSAAPPLKQLDRLGRLTQALRPIALATFRMPGIRQCGFVVRPVISRVAFGRNPRPDDVARVWDQIRSGDPRTYQQAALAMLDNRLDEGLHLYQSKPAAVLAGACDLLTSPTASWHIAELLHTRRLRIYRDAGHMLADERPAEVLEQILAVLGSLKDVAA